MPIEYEQCKKTGRIDAWKWKKGKLNKPHIFWDSDVAKWLEAGAYSLADNPDKKLEKQIDNYIEKLRKGQLKDGYLNSYFSLVEPESRWTNLRDSHELYCAGHLIEAAVAYSQATGKKKFLDIMCRYADHIDETLKKRKPGKKKQNRQNLIQPARHIFRLPNRKKLWDMLYGHAICMPAWLMSRLKQEAWNC